MVLHKFHFLLIYLNMIPNNEFSERFCGMPSSESHGKIFAALNYKNPIYV